MQDKIIAAAKGEIKIAVEIKSFLGSSKICVLSAGRDLLGEIEKFLREIHNKSYHQVQI